MLAYAALARALGAGRRADANRRACRRRSDQLAAVAGGAWFGPLTWPWSTAVVLQKGGST